MLEIVIKPLLGALVGAAIGLFIARGGCCGSDSCSSEKEKCATTRQWPRTIFSAVAGAIFGAAVVWYVMNK